jgi:N utilization substance protein A
LAAKLTGLDIDIRSKTQKEILSKMSVSDLAGVGPKLLEELTEAGYTSVFKVAQTTLEDLLKVKGIGEKTAVKLLEGARELMQKLEVKTPEAAEPEAEPEAEKKEPAGE